jgi:hypothetical protein
MIYSVDYEARTINEWKQPDAADARELRRGGTGLHLVWPTVMLLSLVVRRLGRV